MIQQEQRLSVADAHFEHPANESWLTTVRGVGWAAYTLFNTPKHDSSLYEDLATVLVDEPQPVHQPIAAEVEAVVEVVAQHSDLSKRPRLDDKTLLGTMGNIMQFTTHLPRIRSYAETPFEHVDALYEGIVRDGTIKPLGFADQLDIALDQTKGDLPEAAWRLFITSRQHARWLDSSAISGLPDFSRDEKMERMHAFSQAVAACKPHEQAPIQDTSGDTYYAWTHALARLSFGAYAQHQDGFTRLGGALTYNGTRLLQGLANPFEPQRLKSDHRPAAAYGNAIGDALVKVLEDENVYATSK